jgi:hypothetical protein
MSSLLLKLQRADRPRAPHPPRLVVDAAGEVSEPICSIWVQNVWVQNVAATDACAAIERSAAAVGHRLELTVKPVAFRGYLNNNSCARQVLLRLRAYSSGQWDLPDPKST